MSRRAALTLLFAALALAAPGIVEAETLQDALAAAYRTNPVLQSQRFQQQALDEGYVQAKAGFRPTASVNAGAQYQREPNSSDFAQGFSSSNSGAATITLTQPLYTGGRTTWAVRAAEAMIGAGRQDLRAVEAQVMLSVIQGYVDVLQDQQVLAIRQADLQTLQLQVDESSAKFKLGQVTRTDVAEAQTQLESTRAALAAAEAQVQISAAEYQAAVGAPPHALVDPDRLPGLPTDVDQAFDLAIAANPTLLQSQERERASRAQIAEAKAAYRPTVALQGSYGYIGPVAPFQTRDYGEEATAAVAVTLPLLTGGVTASQVRQATAQNSSDRAAIETARRQTIEITAQTWNQLLSGQAGVKAGQAAVVAAETALKGAQAEYGFGLRTTLDVLISDENLRSAQLLLAQGRHDVVLAEASVLQVSGRLEAAQLLPKEAIYDPTSSFGRVKNASRPPWEGAIQALDELGAPGLDHR